LPIKLKFIINLKTAKTLVERWRIVVKSAFEVKQTSSVPGQLIIRV
jgi:hypothetical protein